MPRSPLFIEAPLAHIEPKLRLCAQVIGMLTAQKVAPIHLATNSSEAAKMLAQLSQQNNAPALIVFNTQNLEDYQAEIDGIFAKIPMLVLLRPMGMKGTLRKPEPGDAPRCRWNFGPVNAKDVTQRTTHAVLQYLRTENFNVFASQAERPAYMATPNPIRSTQPRKSNQTDSKPFFG
jgi:hypothetical protein